MNSVQYPTGALQPIHDPDSVKYALRFRTIPKIGITEILLPDSCLVPIAEQRIGSCAAVSATVAAAMADKIGNNGIQTRYTNAAWLYWHGRVEGKLIDPNNPATWQDTGSFPDVNLKILSGGAPVSDSPNELVGDPRWHPDDALENSTRIDEVLSYAPFYPNTEGMGALCTAINAKMPVVIAMAWHDSFMQPPNGILPIITNPAGIKNGHAIACRGTIMYNSKPYVVGVNQWTRNWTPEIVNIDPRLRPGEFLIPQEVFESPLVWMCEAVTYEPSIAPNPDLFDQGYKKAIADMDQISIDVQDYLGKKFDGGKNARQRTEALANLNGAQYLADELGNRLGMGR